MCQLVATLIHLFLCRYECQNFGFWGVFLAGRFCVYITQMNFLFYRFFVLFHFVYFTAFPNLFRLIVSYFFYRWFVLFVLLYFVPIVSRGGVVSLLTRWLTCHVTTLPGYRVATLIAVAAWSVADVPHYLRLKIWRVTTLWSCEVATLFVLCVPSGGVVLSYFAVQLLQLLGCLVCVHRRHRHRAVNTFNLTC